MTATAIENFPFRGRRAAAADTVRWPTKTRDGKRNPFISPNTQHKIAADAAARHSVSRSLTLQLIALRTSQRSAALHITKSRGAVSADDAALPLTRDLQRIKDVS